MTICGTVHEDDGASDYDFGRRRPLLHDEFIELFNHLEPVDDHRVDIRDEHVDMARNAVVDATLRQDEGESHLTALETLDVSFIACHFEHEAD